MPHPALVPCPTYARHVWCLTWVSNLPPSAHTCTHGAPPLQTRSNALAWNPMEAFNFTLANEDCCLYTFDMRKLKSALCVHKVRGAPPALTVCFSTWCSPVAGAAVPYQAERSHSKAGSTGAADEVCSWDK